MTRGDFVTVTMAGDFGKTRPALVIQSDLFAKHASVTVLLVTGTPVNAALFRVTIQPDEHHGLLKPSQIMVDKTMTVARDRLGAPFGAAGDAVMVEVTRRLAVFLGIAG